MRDEQLTKMKNGEEGADQVAAPPSSASDRVAAVAGQTDLQLGQPNIKPPQVIGVWIAPWRDGRNFLHDASLVYAIVEPADWTYGRKPKGADKTGSGQIFAPLMSRRTVSRNHREKEQGRTGGSR